MARIGAFLQALQGMGWAASRTAQIAYRWGAGGADRYRQYAAELVAFQPDVILAVGGLMLAALQRATRTVPTVFVSVTDPVGSGLIASLARPGGHITGFSPSEYSMSGKW